MMSSMVATRQGKIRGKVSDYPSLYLVECSLTELWPKIFNIHSLHKIISFVNICEVFDKLYI